MPIKFCIFFYCIRLIFLPYANSGNATPLLSDKVSRYFPILLAYRHQCELWRIKKKKTNKKLEKRRATKVARRKSHNEHYFGDTYACNSNTMSDCYGMVLVLAFHIQDGPYGGHKMCTVVIPASESEEEEQEQATIKQKQTNLISISRTKTRTLVDHSWVHTYAHTHTHLQLKLMTRKVCDIINPGHLSLCILCVCAMFIRSMNLRMFVLRSLVVFFSIEKYTKYWSLERIWQIIDGYVYFLSLFCFFFLVHDKSQWFKAGRNKRSDFCHSCRINYFLLEKTQEMDISRS